MEIMADQAGLFELTSLHPSGYHRKRDVKICTGVTGSGVTGSSDGVRSFILQE